MSANSTARLNGGCACGAVRFVAQGAPSRVGLCHCLTCRKAHAAAFNPFAVYDSGRVQVTGATHRWQSSSDYERHFCPRCGSRVFARVAGGSEVEISLGSFDEPGLIEPQYECWVRRREPWIRSLPVPQFAQDRPVADRPGGALAQGSAPS